MIITFVSALAQKQRLIVACENAGFWGPQCPEEILVRSLGSMYVGLGFLGLLAVGKTSMMGRWEFLHAGIFGGLWGFLWHFAHGEGFGCCMDCLLGSLRCMACGPSEHFALQKAWSLWDVWHCWRQFECWMGQLTFVLAWLKVESVVRKRQYELRAQFLWLCRHQSMMSDVHRAGAKRLQNQIKSFFFSNMTQRVELFSSKKKLKELNYFHYDSMNLNFFLQTTQRIQLFFLHDFKNCFFWYDSKIFQNMTLRTVFFFKKIWLKKKIELFFLNVTRRIESFSLRLQELNPFS